MRLEEQPGRKWVKNKDMDSMSGRCSVIARLPAATEEVGGPSRLERDPRLKDSGKAALRSGAGVDRRATSSEEYGKQEGGVQPKLAHLSHTPPPLPAMPRCVCSA